MSTMHNPCLFYPKSKKHCLFFFFRQCLLPSAIHRACYSSSVTQSDAMPFSLFMFSTVSSTFILERTSMIRTSNTSGSHRYINESIRKLDAGCVAAVPTYPLISKSHPTSAVPIPPPILIPRDVQEYIVPSTRFPVSDKYIPSRMR